MSFLKNIFWFGILLVSFGYEAEAWVGPQVSSASGAFDITSESPQKFVVGTYSSMLWKPSAYSDSGVAYDIFYYIPAKLQNSKNYPVLIFLHGGGQSTTTREGSIEIIGRYQSRLIELANALGIAVILPSGSGMNWGTHTPYYMRSLIKMIRASLPVDVNRIGISGHSMGGMAMTRIFYELSDQVSFVLPLAAGLATILDENLLTHFNTPYYQIQGKKDSFDVFVERCLNHQAAVSKLESKLNRKSKYTLELTEGDHSSVLDLLDPRVSMLFKTPRNLFQNKLYGLWNTTPNQEALDVGQKISLFPNMRYFWIEALSWPSPEKARIIRFTAEINQNDVQIHFPLKSEIPYRLRLFFSKKMVDFSKPVRVWVNGVLVNQFKLSSLDRTQDSQELAGDMGYEFEDVVEFNVRRNTQQQVPPQQQQQRQSLVDQMLNWLF